MRKAPLVSGAQHARLQLVSRWYRGGDAGQALLPQQRAENPDVLLNQPKDSFGSFPAGGAPMNFLKDWTSGEGRLSQKGYALYFLAPGAALIVATWLAFALAPGLFGSSGAIVVIAPWMLFLAITDGQNIRRCHDIGN